jgi:small subunit ribosomal protein S15
MARMHSRKHGQSGSTKPVRKRAHWVTYEADEVEKLVQKLSKEGLSNAQIGTTLRDQYGVPDVRALGLRVAKITDKVKKEKQSDSKYKQRLVPEDMYNLIAKSVNLHKHMKANHGDNNTKHGLELLESKIRRLGKYYVRRGVLPENWKYTIEEAKLIVK